MIICASDCRSALSWFSTGSSPRTLLALRSSETFFLGELETTLPLAYKHIGATAVLAHADIGSGRDDDDSANAALLIRLLPRMLRARALVVSDQQLHCAELKPESLPEGVPTDRYFLYRCIR